MRGATKGECFLRFRETSIPVSAKNYSFTPASDSFISLDWLSTLAWAIMYIVNGLRKANVARFQTFIVELY